MKLAIGWAGWRSRAARVAGRAMRTGLDLHRAIRWHFGGGKHFFQRHASEIARAHKWCFIVGCNNSGTSLLQKLLEETGQVSAFVNEGQSYTRAMKRAEKRGYERVWSEYVDELRMTESNGAEILPRLLHDWLSELSLPIQHVIVEKTTANAVRMRWLQDNFPNSYFVGLVRNGYAVSEGIRRKGYKPIARGARHWNHVNKAMIEDGKHLDNFIIVKYEDLARDPLKIASELHEFIQLAEGQSRAKASVAQSSGLINSIVDMNQESFDRLTAEDVAAIRAEAGEMLEYFGYVESVSDSKGRGCGSGNVERSREAYEK